MYLASCLWSAQNFVNESERAFVTEFYKRIYERINIFRIAINVSNCTLSNIPGNVGNGGASDAKTEHAPCHASFCFALRFPIRYVL